MTNSFIEQYKTKTGKRMLIWVSLSLIITGVTYFITYGQSYNFSLVIGEVVIAILIFFWIQMRDRSDYTPSKEESKT